MNKHIVIVTALLGCWSAEVCFGQQAKVLSPNGKIEVSISVREHLYYSISFKGRPVVLDSPVELIFEDAPQADRLYI